jgi:ankyrin repeat protein
MTIQALLRLNFTDKKHVEDILKEVDDNRSLTTAADDNGTTLLHAAASVGNSYLIAQLLVRGASINAQDKEGCKASQLALRGGHPLLMSALLLTELEGNNRLVVEEVPHTEIRLAKAAPVEIKRMCEASLMDLTIENYIQPSPKDEDYVDVQTLLGHEAIDAHELISRDASDAQLQTQTRTELLKKVTQFKEELSSVKGGIIDISSAAYGYTTPARKAIGDAILTAYNASAATLAATPGIIRQYVTTAAITERTPARANASV